MSDPEESVSGEASPDGEADPTGRPVGHRAWRRRVPAIVAVAVTLAAVVLAVTQTVRADDARDALADYAGARGAASAFGEAYLSYDAADVAGSSERVLSLATDRFAEEFEDAVGFGWTAEKVSFDWTTLIANKDIEIERLSRAYVRNLETAGAELILEREWPG